MPSKILDPDDAESSHIIGTVPGILPKHVREFGYFPELSKLKAGDILLFEPKKRNRVSSAIQLAQSELFSDEHARWTHAAVYIYQGRMIEALPFKGVVDGHIANYVSEHNIRARRFPVSEDFLRYHIAFEAMKKRGMPYDIRRIPSILSSLLDITKLNNGTAKRFTICSQLCVECIMRATLLGLEECPPEGPVVPAHLSNTSALNDVEWCWTKIPEKPVDVKSLI